MKAKLSNFVALDLGSSKLAGIAAYVDKKGDAKILSQVLHYSDGIKSGTVTDLKALEHSVTGAIYALEKECGKNIKQVAVSISGAGTKSYYINQKIKLSNQQVSEQEVKKLLQKVLSEFKFKDQEIIHYFPIEFVIDNETVVENPVGMFAKELSCQLHIIAANSSLIMNLTNCFANCQIEISNVSLSIYAAGLACLSEDEQNLGSIIIDIGARTTAFAVFLAGKPIYTGYIPIGSAYITSDIAKVFAVSLTTAEKLKVVYGNAAPSSFNNNKAINLEDIEPDNPYNTTSTITLNQLAEVINSRVEEILSLVKEQYDQTNIDHLIARRMVITGGGSMLRGIKELAGTIFEKQVRIGKPQIIEGFAEDYNPAMYSSVLGVVKGYALKQQKYALDKNSFEMGIDATKGNASWTKKVFAWLKENI